MSSIDTAISIVNLINATAPAAASLILMIRRPDGTVTVAALLDQADEGFDENISIAQKWLAEHKAPAGGKQP